MDPGQAEGIGKGAEAEPGDPSQPVRVNRRDVHGGVAVEPVGPGLHQARLGERACAHGSGAPDHAIPVGEWGECGHRGGPGDAPLLQKGRRLTVEHGWVADGSAKDLVSPSRYRQRRCPFAHHEVGHLVNDGPARSRGGPLPFVRCERDQQPVERGLFVGQFGEKERIDGVIVGVGRREFRRRSSYGGPVTLPRPLEGVRVLDLSQIIAGPACGRVLADLGAEVVKVEAPRGDLCRTVPPIVDGIGALYAQMNAGKRHVCADIRTAAGADVVARMAERCDVLIENFRPGVLAGRGLGYAALATRNPRLVYLSISGFGQTGVWSDRRAHAPLLHAEGGTMEVAARLRGQPPVPEVHQHADLYSGYFGVSAVCAALYQRERTGIGQHLDVALAEVLLYASDQVVMDLLDYDGPREFDTWTYPVATLASGETVCLVGNPLRLFERWMAALGADSGAAPLDEQAASALVTAATSRFADAAALRAALAADGLVCTVVQPATTLLDSEWATERKVLGLAAPGVRAPAAPWRSSAAEIRMAGPATPVGADTRAVLQELLQLSETELDALAASGAIRAGPA
jgi:CoA:oxalate CoA-transferase